MDRIEELALRLEEMERRYRRMQRTALATCVVAAAAGLVAWTSPDGTVEAKRFVLQDEAGRTRGEWRPAEDGSTTLELHDQAGKPRVRLAIDAQGFPKAELLGQRGSPNVQLSVGQDMGGGFLRDFPFLRMQDPEGRESVKIHVDEGQCPVLEMNGVRLSAFEGRKEIFLSDQSGRRRVRIGVDADGTTRIELFDGNGQSIWRAPE